MSSESPNTSSILVPAASPSASSRTRRLFLQAAGAGMAGAVSNAMGASIPKDGVEFPPISAKTEAPEKSPSPALPPDERIGFAIVGLGRLSVQRLLPAFGESKYAKLTALVSGDREKAMKIAKEHALPEARVYDYRNFDRIAEANDVQVVYIVLPNGMHMEYTVRAAKAGKHVLCEKPMANSVREAERMIAACREADRKLMIAYRMQYEPTNRAVRKMVAEGKLGQLREFVSVNSQAQGDPDHWRLKRALAGGGSLPDIGLYPLNNIRFLAQEEPIEVFGQTYSTPGDPRFAEVEESCQFMLRFASGLTASCSTGYSSHQSRMYRLMGTQAWAEMDPAYPYFGQRARIGQAMDQHESVIEPGIEPKDQFARELDHMARCVIENRTPYTPGEEGLQDQRLMEAIYASAKSGRAMKVEPPSGKTRGPEPQDD